MSPAAAMVATIVLKATLLVALAAAADGLVMRRRASAAARHLLWSFAIAGVLLLPVLTVALPGWRVPLIPAATPIVLPAAHAAPPLAVDPPHAGMDGSTSTASTSPAPSTEAVPSSGPEPSISGDAAASVPVPWETILFAAYLAGVLLLLARVAAEQRVVRRLARTATPVRDAEWSALLRSLAASLGVRRRVALLRGDAPTMPLTWGMLRPAVLLPAEADAWPQARRHAVLLHELAHVARHDCLTQTLAAVACALYWPHPGVWLAARRLRVERELACDDQALAGGIRAVDYAGHLLELARGLRSPRALASVAVSMASPSHLEMRLRAAIDGGRVRTAPGRGARMLAATLAVLLLFPLSAMRAGTAESVDAGPALDSARPTMANEQPDRRVNGSESKPDSVVSAAAQEPFGGEWALRLATPQEAIGGATTVHVMMMTPGLNTFYIPLDQIDGLTAARIASSDAAAVRFRLRRDAGTFDFEGTFRGGRGTGRFGFTADPAFSAALVRRGMEAPTPRQQFSLARHGVTLAYLDELARLGYAVPSTATLDRAGMSSADQDYVREMAALGYRLGTLDALLRASNSGVDPRYVRDLEELGYRRLPVADLVRMRNNGVDAAFIRRVGAPAGRPLSVDELVRLRANGGTAVAFPPAVAGVLPPLRYAVLEGTTPYAHLSGPAGTGWEEAANGPVFSVDRSTPVSGRWIISATRGEVAQMELQWDDDTQWRRSIGLAAFSGLSAGEIGSAELANAAFRIEQDAGTFAFEGLFQGGRGTGRFRFTPNRGFVSTLRSLGIATGEVSDHQLKNLAFSSISAADVREFKGLFPSLDMREMMELAVRIVSPEYARTMRSLGVEGANTVRGVVELRFYNVPTAYVRELAGLGYRGLTYAQVTEMWRIGVTAAFIRGAREAGGQDVSPEALIQMREREHRGG